MKKILGACVLLLAAGCAPDNIKQTTALASDEGIVVLVPHCGSAVLSLEFYPADSRWESFGGALDMTGMSTCEEGVKTIRIKQGRYAIGKMGARGVVGGIVVPRQYAYFFTVRADKLNYIGDIHGIEAVPADPRTAPNVKVSAGIAVSNEPDRARAEIARLYPWLLERHEFIESPAAMLPPGS
ncbi:MAG TPA: hypothetical protein VJ806_15490 [Luteimonas sp.]|nr:hypothetical protein [Luteimonas sp.]